MPVQLYVSGPVDVFVGTGASGALECLGYTEEEVVVDLVELRRPVRVSITGPMVGFDQQLMGKELRVPNLHLVYYDEPVAVRLLASSSGGVNPFVMLANATGSLCRQERVGGFRCLLRSRYGLGQPGFHPQMANMIPFVNIPFAMLSGPQSRRFSTEVANWRMSLEAIPDVNPATGAYVLGNFDATGLPTVTYVT